MDSPKDSSYEFAGPKPEVGGGAGVPAAGKPAEPVAERLCPNCGFKVYGKLKRGRCPQCAAPLDSRSADLLQFGDAGWIRMLVLGTLLLAAALVMHVGGLFVIWYWSQDLGQFMLVAGAGLMAAGAGLVTRREPFGEEVPASGIMARWLPVTLPVVWFLIYWLVLGRAHRGAQVLTLTALAVSAGACVALSLFLRRQAMRIPSDYLSLQFMNLAWAMPGLLGLAAVYQLQLLDVKSYFANIFFCSFPLVGGLIGLLLWVIHTLLRLSVELWLAARAAEAAEYRRTHPVTPSKA